MGSLDGSTECRLGDEVMYLALDFIRADGVAVHLVKHDDGLEAVAERLGEYELGLGHRALRTVDQHHHAIDHAQHALHLSSKVAVPCVSSVHTRQRRIR
jgi:hypothetical protein